MPRLIYQDATGGSGVVDIGAQPVFIGRAVDCQIQTQDAQVSRRHARVFFDGVYWIEDNGSANGIFIGTERVQRAQLRPGDVFRCGHLQVRFEADGAPAVPPPAYSAPPAAPPPMAPPPVALPPVAPPVAAPPVASADPTAGLRAGAAELQSVRGELETERRRRTDLEFELSESKRKIDELGAKVAAAGDPAETERLKRRVEQLESDLRRRGNASPPSGNPEALRAAEAERDRLRTRVSELEAQLAAPAPAKDRDKGEDGDAESARLKRRVEQLESDLRRLRANKPAAPESKPEAVAPSASAAAQAADDKLQELEEQLRKLTQERDEAMRKALTSAGQDIRITEELDKARRRIEQLESELKRRPVAAMNDVQRMDQQQQQLESALRQLRDTERDRDALKEVIARGAAPARPPQKAIDGLTTVSDGLADIRTALRAAGDDAALDQLEQLRTALRQALSALGVSG
ncbi:MAG: FHA domain-containing protein [Polyangia bacterium]